MFKKILLFIFAALCLLLLVIFIRPGILINPENLKFLLNKSETLKDWSWEEAQFKHESFIFESCLKEVSWDLKFKWSLSEGFIATTVSPFVLSSDLMNITLL